MSLATSLRPEGRSELAEGPDSGTSWRLKEGRITALAPRAAAGKGVRTGWPSMPAGAGETPVRPFLH
ncbi:hypothetical protein QPK32_12450 [Massilia sp. YIM B02763]|uniref:hypothetical protein n=1 Tax=Massilia sp. YIM B02763 TaxID=3050130 RepID=UPI0025B6959D|nr:hypothetical protein [Massilia sp. YIM B02763]MDN4053889.1 hypothetical protein [Massilia sp. YIM B02763]